MKNYKHLVCTALVGGVLAFGLSACGDEDSSFAPNNEDDNLSSVADSGEGSSSSVKGGSSSSKGGASGSSSSNGTSSESNSSSSAAEESGSSAEESSSSAEESSSSIELCIVHYPEKADTTKTTPAEYIYEQKESCEDVKACDAMDEKDVSTWHFVREDKYGDDVTYTYKVDGYSLILVIEHAEGVMEIDHSYDRYDMTLASHVAMAFDAVKSACEDGNGNKNTVKSCTMDSVRVSKNATWTPENVNAGSNYDAKANTLTDLRDGKVYKTVKIGDQVWMAQNLNYAYLNATHKGDQDELPGLDSSSFCINNVSKNCERWGRMYMWSAAMDSAAVFDGNGAGCGYYDYSGKYASVENTCKPTGNVRGVCPKGWHVPSMEEVEKMLSTVDEPEEDITWGSKYPNAGILLRSVCGWGDNLYGEDKYGFKAIPSGWCYVDGKCRDTESSTEFWTSTPSEDEDSDFNARTASMTLFLPYRAKAAELSRAKRQVIVPLRCVMD